MLSFLKKWFCLMASCLLLCAVPAQAEEVPNTTVMIYMCGSNLESMNGAASSDIMEMLAAGYSKEDVQVVLMTGGAESWNGVGVNPSATAVYEITKRGGLRCRWDESLLNMGESDTLSFFLNYAAENYPAQRYALIMWDHGGGPLSGVCWDEIASDHLTLDEVTQALDASPFAHRPLEWIGFDACLMASAEVAWQMAPYARYMVASEETEPACGWNYSFLSGLEQDADGAATGKRIIESYMAGAQGDDTLTLSCIDLSKIDGLRASMSQYFDFLGQSLTEETFSRHSRMRSSTEAFGESILRAVTDTVTGDYDLVDLGHLLKQNTDDSWMQKEALEALESCVVASASTEEGHHGLSVYFPLNNKTTYEQKWGREYSKLNFSDGYTGYVRKFGQILTQDALTDWSSFFSIETEDSFDGEAVQLALQFTPEQLDNLASARLVALGEESFRIYYRTYVSPGLTVDENGRLEAEYNWETLHAVDDLDGHIMTPSIDFYVTENGEYAVTAAARKSMAEDAYELPLILLYERIPGCSRLQLKGVQVYDEQTQTYSGRLSFDLAQYPYLAFVRTCRTHYSHVDEEYAVWPGFDSWPEYDRIRQSYVISTENAFHLEFVIDDHDEPIVCFEITDTQNNVYLIRAAGNYSMLAGYLAEDEYMSLSADALMMDESGVYLSLSSVNKNARVFEEDRNQHFFLSPQINGVPCRFGDGTCSQWVTEPETISGKVLHFEWPEGVTLENAHTLGFRILSSYPEGYVSDKETVSEYAQLTWDPALTAGRSAVSLSASSFEATQWLEMVAPEELPIMEQEILASGIENCADALLVLPVPQDVRKAENGCLIAARHIGETALEPLWIVYPDSQDASFRLPDGYLFLALNGREVPVPAAVSADGKNAMLAGEISFRLAGEFGSVTAGQIGLDLSCGMVNGMVISGSAAPVGAAEEVSLSLASLTEPDGMLITDAAPVLPFRLEMRRGLPDDTVLLTAEINAAGETVILKEEPLAQAVQRREQAAVQDFLIPQLFVDENGVRRLRYGDFLAEMGTEEAVVIGYAGAEEAVAVPETINGLPVTAIDIQSDHSRLKQITLPSTLRVRTEPYEAAPNEYACAYLEGFSALETILVPACEAYARIPLNHFFLGHKSPYRIYNTDPAEYPYQYSTAQHAVRGAEELWFEAGFYYVLDADGRAVITDHEAVQADWFDFRKKELRIPSQLNGSPVAGIGENAFRFENHFLRLIVEEGIEWIGDQAFEMADFREITLPGSLRSIGENVFSLDRFFGLETVHASLQNSAYLREYFRDTGVQLMVENQPEDGLFRYDFAPDGTAVITGFAEGAAPEGAVLVIPSSVGGYPVSKIAESAFQQQAGFTELVIEEGILEIGRNAFQSSYDLAAVTLPSTLKRIESNAFFCCRALRELSLPDSMEYLAPDALYGSGVTALHFNRLPDEMTFEPFCDTFSVICCPEALWEQLPDRFQNTEMDRILYAPGEEKQSDGFAWVVLGEGAAILSGPAEAEELVIPQTLEGHAVTHIASYAFAGSTARTVVLPDGLRSIGSSAFAGCAGLQAFILPDSVQFIGEQALQNCKALQRVHLSPELALIPEKLFDGCAALQEVEIPFGPLQIGYWAFGGCSMLEEISIPASVQVIEGWAFPDDALKAVILPQGTAVAEAYAFQNGAAFYASEEAYLQVLAEAEAQEQAEAALRRYCGPSIQWSLSEDGTLSLNGNGPMYSFYTSRTYHKLIAPEDHAQPWEEVKDQIRTVVIGEGITSIGKKAFENCETITSVVLPQTLTAIAEDAFYRCEGLTALAMPDSLLAIGDQAFRYCEALETVSFSQRLETLGKNAFSDCYALGSIQLPESLVSVGSQAFWRCTSLKTIVFPQTMQTISADCFSGCSALEELVLPQALKEIQEGAFSSCESLQTIVFPEDLQTIGNNAFSWCTSLRTLELPAGLKTIEYGSFSYCPGLTAVLIPDGTETIGHSAFRDSLNITLIDIPASVTEIGADLFLDTAYIDYTGESSAFVRSPNYDYLLFIVDEGSAAHAYVQLYDLRYELRE